MTHQGELEDYNSDDWLLQKRYQQHKKIGELSTRLSEATAAHNDSLYLLLQGQGSRERHLELGEELASVNEQYLACIGDIVAANDEISHHPHDVGGYLRATEALHPDRAED